MRIVIHATFAVSNVLVFKSRVTGIPIPPEGADQQTLDAFAIPAWKISLITSILSAGTFFGAIMAGDLADFFGRRVTIVTGCIVFIIGCVLQVAYSSGLGLIVAGRLISGFGVGFVSAIIILYMSEIAPRKVRGAIVSGYQFVSALFVLCRTMLILRPLLLVSCSLLASSTVLRTD